MLDQLLVSLILAPSAGVVASRILVDRLHPKQAVLGFTFAAVLFALASTASLLAFGMPAVASVVGFAPDLRAVARSWHIAVAPLWASWTCLALSAAAVVSVLATGRRQRGSLRAARVQAAALPGAGEIVVVPDGRADAFALPGSPGRIVVTEGMLAAVGDGRHDALLAHERAHLAGRHHLFAFAARLAVAALPPLRPMVTLIDYAIERWADERAAAEVGDRRSVAHAVGTAALAATEQVERQPGAPRLPSRRRSGRLRTGEIRPQLARERPTRDRRASGPRPAVLRAVASGRGPRPGPVPRRVAALLVPALRENRLLLVALPAAVAAASCGVAVEALLDVPYRRVFGLART